MYNRRELLKTLAAGSGLLTLSPELWASPQVAPFFEISLAEWSLHKAIFGGKMSNLDFPAKARNDFGIGVVEYVNTLFGTKTTNFKENGKNATYLAELLKRCKDNGIKNHLIMCDAEGDLGDADPKKRLETVENHKKWLDAAKYLGCATIRVNAAGKGSAEEVAKNAADGLAKLSELAATLGLNVIVENHGSHSSNGQWLAGVMKAVNMKNCGTLPDFGNFCIKWQAGYKGCDEAYDRYQGTAELMPFAKGVSAKSNVFDTDGNERNMDYVKLLKIVKEAGFNGYIGIEYEGNELGEDEGIRATKKLLEKVAAMM
jgi:sugar phosphate isomerase/epimerase